ncbi:hypothetical protein Ocin01_06139 [Orchesella cincta]|uniref:Uncharacterized protein n=1 Tax=Orchesella cincta TaxID=48709 RepID=A0A1D2N634_ORCCI|nr:hypothetical protein Ocin01_06139 [Orchesella cincta]
MVKSSKKSAFVRILAFYLVGVSILGTLAQLWFFIISVITQAKPDLLNPNIGNYSEDFPNADADFRNGTIASVFTAFLESSLVLYQRTFPVISPIVSDMNSYVEYSSNYQNQPKDFSSCAILVTLLPSILLLRGLYKLNYTNCQFWYFTQVASVLMSCMKITVITCAGLWDGVTNAALISTLLGLGQIVLVQNFMESLQREKTVNMRNKYHFHLLSVGDLELKNRKTGETEEVNKTEGKHLSLNMNES